MIRIYRETRRGRGKKAGVYRVRCGVECIFQSADPGGRTAFMPALRDRLTQAAEWFLRSRAAAAFIAAAMTGAVYRYCGVLAWLERGGKTAYGGECLAALTAGICTYRVVRGLSERG